MTFPSIRTVTRITIAVTVPGAGMLCAGQVRAAPGNTVAPPSGSPAPHSGLCDLPGAIGTACDGLKKVVTDAGGNATGQIVSSAFDAMVKSLLRGLAKALEWCLDWWITLPSPALADPATGAPGPVLTAVREYTGDLQLLLMTGAIIVTGARLAMARRGGLVAETQETFLVFARAVLASWMFAALVAVGTRFGDAFSTWVITDATNNDASTAVKNMVNADLASPSNGLGSGAMFLVAILGVIGALLQLVLLVIRQALLIVVVALIPVAASAAGTGPGSQAYKRLVSWSLAFMLYKPVGALVYVVAFSAGSRPGSDPQQTLLSLILLALVSLVLPAIIRLVAPAVATMGGSSMGMIAAGAVGAGIGHAIGSRGANSSGSESSGARPVDEHSGGPGAADSGGGRWSGRPTGGGSATDSGAATSAPQATAGTGGAKATAAGAGGEAAAGAGAAAGPMGAAASAAVETGKKLYGGMNEAATPDPGDEVPQ